MPGVDPAPESGLPGWLRSALAVQATVMLAAGALLFFNSGDTSWWPWDLTPLTSQAVGTWLLGIGTSAAYVVWHNDRADIPAPSLSFVVFGALLLLGLVRFPGDIDFGQAETWAYLAFVLSALTVGAAGTRLALREGRFASVRGQGGVPVELAGPPGN